MTVLVWLIPVALFLGLLGLAAFLWSMRTGQFDDLEGAAHRILFDDDEDGAEDRAANAEPSDDAASPRRREGGQGSGNGRGAP
ncbi:MAG: cbb3-type cytochrome oxidase assembly protein CcoS [Azospirillaceae bacterium]